MRIKDNLTLSSNCNNDIIGFPEDLLTMTMLPAETYMSVDNIKMEPLSPPARGRKRNFSQTSWAGSQTGNSTSTERKKLKKYELDPSSDPSVKNAVAAKINRDKKKQEELKLKADNENLRASNLELQKKLEHAFQVQDQLRRELEEERAKSRTVAEQDMFESAGTLFSFLEKDLNKNASEVNQGNDDLADIDVDSSLANFDLRDYFDPEVGLFGSPESPEKAVAQSPAEVYCPQSDSEHSLSEFSACLDPVLTLSPSIRPDDTMNAIHRNLLGEFNNIVQYLSD